VIDLHVHTYRCRHAEGTPSDYVRAAALRGVATMAFTDHLPLAPELAERVPGAEAYAMAAEELPLYVSEVAEARDLGKQLAVEVLCGIEADLVSTGIETVRALVEGGSFDIVLGSVHFIDDWAFDDPSRREQYDRWSPQDLWARYFADLAGAAAAGIADVMAHADLVKKFSFAPDGPLDALYEQTAEALHAADVAVEVNTAGLRKPCRELYPAPAFLRALNRAGVPVTVGSDAHAPGEVGAGWLEAVAALREAGYGSALVFRGRVPEEVGLDVG